MKREVIRVTVEALAILVLASCVGLTFNTIRDKGLSLSRNYFKVGQRVTNGVRKTISPSPVNGTDSTEGETTSITSQPPDDPTVSEFTPEELDVVERLESEGLQAISHSDVEAIVSDPQYTMGAYVLIDARSEDLYIESHIPLAMHMDYYYIDRYRDTVLPMCQGALTVVVYCGGGECEDSELAALELLKMGVNPEKIHVYIGGMKQWQAKGLQVEIGVQGSGDLVQPSSEEVSE